MSVQALPEQITLAFSDCLGRVPPGRFISLPTAKAGLERVSVATFLVALCILAMQVILYYCTFRSVLPQVGSN